jgi:ABC-type Na+ efflux pump permease subunit
VIRIIKNIYHITCWEFTTRIKSRSFIFLTFILPLVVLILFAFPLQLNRSARQDAVKLIGLVNLNEVQIVEQIQNHVNQNYFLDSGSPGYIFMPVSLNESVQFMQMYKKYQALHTRKDSVTTAYEQIVTTRTNYYKNPDIKEKEALLEKTYQDMIEIRDVKELIEKEYTRWQEKVDSVHVVESKRIADSLLQENIIYAYVIIPEDFKHYTTLQYYSLHMDDLADARRVQKIISDVAVKLKMIAAGLDAQLVEQWLKPVHLEKIYINKGLLKTDSFVQFYVSITTVTFLLISIFTACGFLLSSVYKDKIDKTIEFLISKTSSRQIMLGKIVGHSLLGFVQIVIWSGLIDLLLYLNFFPLAGTLYFHLSYVIYFLIIYVMGYLFYAALLFIAGIRISAENEIQRINRLVPVLIFMCILLLFLIPAEFKALTLKVLLYFPFFTPFLMIINLLKGSLRSVEEIYFISFCYMLITMILLYLAYRNFKKILYF